jgi:hypothetical protein
VLLNELLTGLEKEDMFNRLIFERVTPGQLLRAVLLGLTGLLLLYGLVRLARSRYRVDPAAPLLATSLGRLAPAGPDLQQRHQALAAGGNLWEPAHDLAREFFRSALGPAALKDSQADHTPAVEGASSELSERSAQQQVLRLWRLAHASVPVRVTAAEFASLAVQVRVLQGALDEGTLRLHTG